MNNATLQDIVQSINEGTCLVFLGPHLLSADGTSINAQLNKHLVETLGNRVRYYQDEGFLSFDTSTRNLRVKNRVVDFFGSLEPTDLYRKIAEIPFSMVINTAPDNTLNKVLTEMGMGFDYDYYNKSEPPKNIIKTQARSIYNLFGDYTNLDSMILTYQDLFVYLQSILGDKELPIKEILQEAQSVLFFGFSFDKWYFQLLLWLMEINGKGLNLSHDINQESIKNFYIQEFNVEFFENNTAAEIIEALHEAKTKGEIVEPDAPEITQLELFISYAWKGASEEMADLIETTLKANQINLLRDKNDLEYKGGITEFMNRIGEAKGVVVVVSDKYLKSGYCMYELTEIYSHKDFKGRIFPVVLEDAKIFDPSGRLDYKKEWKQKLDQLDQEIKKTGAEAIKTLGEQYVGFQRIHDEFDDIVNQLADMNVLTPDIHKSTHFEKLIKAIRENT